MSRFDTPNFPLLFDGAGGLKEIWLDTCDRSDASLESCLANIRSMARLWRADNVYWKIGFSLTGKSLKLRQHVLKVKVSYTISQNDHIILNWIIPPNQDCLASTLGWESFRGASRNLKRRRINGEKANWPMTYADGFSQGWLFWLLQYLEQHYLVDRKHSANINARSRSLVKLETHMAMPEMIECFPTRSPWLR